MKFMISTKIHTPDRSLGYHCHNLPDGKEVTNIIPAMEPDKIYQLTAQSHVAVNFDSPGYACTIKGLGTTTILKSLIEIFRYPHF